MTGYNYKYNLLNMMIDFEVFFQLTSKSSLLIEILPMTGMCRALQRTGTRRFLPQRRSAPSELHGRRPYEQL